MSALFRRVLEMLWAHAVIAGLDPAIHPLLKMDARVILDRVEDRSPRMT
ncbi:hypothetical protein [uncultured Bradyrhizobium sp.]|nr:hypothetical protein [uncultured Bradyrhizobium sp.]